MLHATLYFACCLILVFFYVFFCLLVHLFTSLLVHTFHVNFHLFRCFGSAVVGGVGGVVLLWCCADIFLGAHAELCLFFVARCGERLKN